ncbi:MAG: DUF4263 domain-containing protein [Firmicutes bacterium]|nr:DUF4263 domain-containing protein [Bacillota bacterium]
MVNLLMIDFQKAIEKSDERDVQKVLKEHPDILRKALHKYNSSYEIVKSQFALGSNYKADFVIVKIGHESMENIIEVCLIEIESPTAKIFNRNGTFSKKLNIAMRQIDDWMVWINSNRETFLNLVNDLLIKSDASNLSSIPRNPTLLIERKIIIGRKYMLLDDNNARRMAIYANSQKSIEIITYDRLLKIVKN